MTRNGRAYRQRLWVPAISDTAGGALPTPRTCSAMAAPINSTGNLQGKRFPNLETVIGRMLPTPAACVANDGERPETWLARRERVKLTAKNGNGMGMPLTIAAQLLTSCASDWKGRTNWQAAGRDGPQRLSDCLPIGGGYVSEPVLCRGDDGLSRRVDRLRALGNAVVPQVAMVPLARVLDLHHQLTTPA